MLDSYEPDKIFEEQLKKCGVEYFDFYLLHNVNEFSLPTYVDKRWGIIDYFVEQKRLGRIKHLGFSSHGSPENLKEFLDLAGDKMEFCQIQLNYLDWTLQRAEEKCQILAERGIPVWVMEPVRGGRLVNKLPTGAKQELTDMRPEESLASWCFRWLMTLDNMGVILSGMSNMQQIEDNIKTFCEDKPLTEVEVKGCPMELNIPGLIEIYNDLRYDPSVNISSKVEFMPEDKRPTACICCGNCIKACPQNIDIPKTMIDLSNLLKTIPSWKEISRQRAAEAAKMSENLGK